MAIKVYWTHFTKTELKSIFDYYKINASLKIASGLVTGIIDKGDTLNSLVEVGQKEEVLSDRKEEFRYLIFKNYKIPLKLKHQK